MKKEIDSFINPRLKNENKVDVNILYLNYLQTIRYQGDTIYTNSLLFILVSNGNSTIEINFKEYFIQKNNIILLSLGHFFKILQSSEDFECTVLHIGKEYIEEMYSTDMLYKRTKYNVKMYNIPQVYLSSSESTVLNNRLKLVNNEIKNTEHIYQKELVLSAIQMFFLELSNIIEQQNKNKNLNSSRDEVYFQKFLDLLANNYRKEHLVEFYAQSLHITTHYLNIIVKRLTRQTVSDLVFQLIFREAKLLLKNPDIPIQQIAELLHFSDQSAFGKFFKRKEGISASEYRKSSF